MEPHGLALIGFGEAASAFVEGWGTECAALTRAYDIKTDSDVATVRDRKYQDYLDSGVQGCARLVATLSGATTVFSLVTADQAGVAARNAAGCIEKGALYLDCNSCSPGHKKDNARSIAAASGLYVDVAIMAPVRPGLHCTPLLVSGPHTGPALDRLRQLGMSATVAGAEVGDASSIKMIRSIVMKGLEAIAAECVLAGRIAGVDEAVLSSLEQSYPGFDWERRAGYMLERMMTHGVRRAAEMKEVSATLAEIGLDTALMDATVGVQQRIGGLELTAGSTDYRVLADQVLRALVPDH